MHLAVPAATVIIRALMIVLYVLLEKQELGVVCY